MAKLNEKYDVIVIGSGTAGISAAIACLNYGLNVLLISKFSSKSNSFSTIESIHPGVLKLLKQLNFSNLPSDCILGEYNYISNGNTSKSLNPYTKEIWTGFHISKTTFNNYLIEEANAKNLNFHEASVSEIIFNNTRAVGVKTDKGDSFIAKYLIDASGNAKLSGKVTALSVTYHSQRFIVLTGRCSSVSDFNAEPNVSYFSNKQNRWTWIGQLNDKSFYWTKMIVKTKEKISIKEEMKQFQGYVLDKSADMRWRIFKPSCQEGLILCGDAACLIDPAGGQGILTSLMHGIKAAYCIKMYFDNPTIENFMLADYNNWLDSKFQHDIKQLRITYEELGIV